MIDKKELSKFIEGRLEGTDYFLVDLHVGPENDIRVEIDSDGVADLERCIELTRDIEAAFDRDAEDYELEVGTAGLTSPLRTPRQFRKHAGHEMEVLTADGRKLHGLLKEADDQGFTLVMKVKVKPEGAKRPVETEAEERIPYTEVKSAVYDLKF